MEWISVKDRLPELHESYLGSPLTSGTLLIFNGHYVAVGEYKETFRKRIRRWEWQFGANINVTHWMPLPAPPEAR